MKDVDPGKVLDQMAGIFKAMLRVPKWRFFIAMLFLGKEVSDNIRRFNG